MQDHKNYCSRRSVFNGVMKCFINLSSSDFVPGRARSKFKISEKAGVTQFEVSNKNYDNRLIVNLKACSYEEEITKL